MKKNSTNRTYLWEPLLFVCFYGILASMYYIAIWINRGGLSDPSAPFFNSREFLNWGGIDYILKLLLSLPVWWLLFRRLRHWPLYKRLLIHCITLPLFVLSWQQLYYLVTEALDMPHLQDLGQIWDTYITVLFYILAFGVLHAYTYFQENQRKLQVEAELRETALKSELAALKAQLNPHFLYNVFNTINASIPPQMEATRQMIAELSDLFRYLLQASKSELVPLQDELGFTRKYLSLEQARFEERLRIVMDVPDSLLNRPVPPMILQPIVENAVKHGISPLIGGGQITVSIQETNSRLAFTIADTGTGIADKSNLVGKGTGLTNTASRLEKMFGTSLQFTDTVPQGLTVKFTL